MLSREALRKAPSDVEDRVQALESDVPGFKSQFSHLIAL